MMDRTIRNEIVAFVLDEIAAAHDEWGRVAGDCRSYPQVIRDHARSLRSVPASGEDAQVTAAKASLLVLCAARAGQSWGANMLKDFDFAIDACRNVITRSQHSGQRAESAHGNTADTEASAFGMDAPQSAPTAGSTHREAGSDAASREGGGELYVAVPGKYAPAVERVTYERSREAEAVIAAARALDEAYHDNEVIRQNATRIPVWRALFEALAAYDRSTGRSV